MHNLCKHKLMLRDWLVESLQEIRSLGATQLASTLVVNADNRLLASTINIISVDPLVDANVSLLITWREILPRAG
jgi:hypothetical protein